MKDHIAGVIRKVTVPPVLAAVMLLIFRGVFGERFISVPLFVVELICLVIVPVSAYPLSMLGGKEKGGRETQRKLAFVTNFLGYGAALVIGIAGGAEEMLLGILWGYFLAVIVLTFLKRAWYSAVLHFYLFFCQFLGIRAAVVCAPLYLAEFWASVRLKRHTVKEFLTGSLTALVVFLLVRN